MLVSMAAGLTLQRLREMAASPAPSCGSCPTLPAPVGAGLTLYVPPLEVTEEQLSAFLTLMSASGRLEPLEERLIDAGSAVARLRRRLRQPVSGALADGAVTCGLPVTRHGATPPRWCWVRRSWLSSPTSTLPPRRMRSAPPPAPPSPGSGPWSGAASARRPWRPSLPPKKDAGTES